MLNLAEACTLLAVILLVIRFGHPKRRGRGYSGARPPILNGFPGCLRLGITVRKDFTAILIARGTLPVRVVGREENVQEPCIRDFLRVEFDENGFGMAGSARADLLVGRM